MNKLQLALRGTSQQGSLIKAIVTDVIGTHASVKVSGIGARYHALEVIGGPVAIGDEVKVKFASGLPYILAPVRISPTAGETIVQSRSSVSSSAPDVWLPWEGSQSIFLSGSGA